MEKWRKRTQKKEAFTLSRCHSKCGSHSTASAPGKLLEARIQGPGLCLPESESLGWSPGSCVLTKAAGVAYAHWSLIRDGAGFESTVYSFSKFSQTLPRKDWVSEIRGGGFSLFTFSYRLNFEFSSATPMSYHFDRYKNNKEMNLYPEHFKKERMPHGNCCSTVYLENLPSL